MSGPRIIPPGEARNFLARCALPLVEVEQWDLDVAHTAAVLGEQREAVLALCNEGLSDVSEDYAEGYFSALSEVARLLGVE